MPDTEPPTRRPRDRRTLNGASVRAIRQARGLTLAQVAAASGLHHSHLSRVERPGGRPGSGRTIDALALALDVAPDVLTGQLPPLAVLREARGITEQQMADALWVAPGVLYRIEVGAEPLTEPLILGAASRLGVDPDALRPTRIDTGDPESDGAAA